MDLTALIGQLDKQRHRSEYVVAPAAPGQQDIAASTQDVRHRLREHGIDRTIRAAKIAALASVAGPREAKLAGTLIDAKLGATNLAIVGWPALLYPSAMLVVRATKRLCQLLGVEVERQPPASGGTLGDWYGNWLPTSVGPLIVLMNGGTRLAVVSIARNPDALREDFRSRLRRLLGALGVPLDKVRSEADALDQVVFAKTLDRSLLGSLNEICSMVAAHDDNGALVGPKALARLEDRLATMVHMKLVETHPADAVRARLASP